MKSRGTIFYKPVRPNHVFTFSNPFYFFLQAINCGQPSALNINEVSQADRRFMDNAQVTIHCREGYHLGVSQPTQYAAICQWNGVWNGALDCVGEWSLCLSKWGRVTTSDCSCWGYNDCWGYNGFYWRTGDEMWLKMSWLRQWATYPLPGFFTTFT